MKFIAIQGISGSWKTTLAKRLSTDEKNIFHIGLDGYFHEWERIIQMKNKEDISALNLELLQIDIDKLKNTHLLTRRRYDFIQKKSTVIDEVIVAEDSTIIIEWLHAFHIEDLIGKFSKKVFLDTPIEIAMIRRMQRDYSDTDPERKIKPIGEYLKYIELYLLPSHHKIRESGKTQADSIITNSSKTDDLISIAKSSL